MGRKIAIVGAGAVGGYAGAHMVQAGEDVTFVDPWPEHVEHMRARLHEVATAQIGEYYVDDHMRNIPDHWHAHARPKGGFFGARRGRA